jgi:hypothetical protein
MKILTQKVLPIFLLVFSLSQVCLAQGGGLDIDIDLSTEPAWYEQTWVMVGIGVAVFILILAAILKNNGRK